MHIYVCTRVHAYIMVRMCKQRAVSGLYLVGRLSGYLVGLPVSYFTNYIYICTVVYMCVCVYSYWLLDASVVQPK